MIRILIQESKVYMITLKYIMFIVFGKFCSRINIFSELFEWTLKTCYVQLAMGEYRCSKI